MLGWRRSAAQGAGTAFDAATSYHRGSEANVLLADSNGQFGGKAIGVKAGVFVGGALLQCVLLRWASHRDAGLSRMLTKSFTILNFGAAGVYGAAGVHNLGVPSRP